MELPLNHGAFRWPYNGMLKDLRTAIAGRANYLAALGLLVYTEVTGRWILQQRGTARPDNRDAFYCFYEEYMQQERSETEKVYEWYRHGAAHVYGFLSADLSVVAMNPDPDLVLGDAVRGIVMEQGGKIKTFVVNAYFRDFQRGLARASDQYPGMFRNS